MNPSRGPSRDVGPDYVTGAEAAALLGVKRPTLYAYASRGLVRSEPSGRGKARRYLREDLERLAARSQARSGHGPVAAGALRWGEPVLASSLTRIDETTLRYRGHDAVRLAEACSFEAVAELLWTGELPVAPPRWTVRSLGVDATSLAAVVPERAHLLARLAIATSVLGAAASNEIDEDRRARALILRLAAAVGGIRHPARMKPALAEGTVARVFLSGFARPLDPTSIRALDTALVLLADHELNVSAFAVRVAASAGSDVHACVSAGLAALAGPLHGGSCDRVAALLDDARARGDRVVLREHRTESRAIPGLGHPLYPSGDPRFPPLLEAALRVAPRSAALARARTFLDAARDEDCPPPTVDFGLVCIASALGLPSGSAAAIFALGRTAGWIAHRKEQREAGFLLRPRARYVGRDTP